MQDFLDTEDTMTERAFLDPAAELSSGFNLALLMAGWTKCLRLYEKVFNQASYDFCEIIAGNTSQICKQWLLW